MEVIEGYSVLITDNDHNTRGTGTLFCSLQDSKHFYILTCAHVIDNADKITINILIPTQDDPEEKSIIAYKNQFFYSPIDEVTIINNQKYHSCDIAIIQCEVGDLKLLPTHYYMMSMSKGDQVIAIGYPGSLSNHKRLYYKQAELNAKVTNVLKNENHFIIRIDEPSVNNADREYELKGYSGSPLWNKAKIDENIFLCGGVVSEGEGKNVALGRIKVINSNYLRELMQQKFGIIIEMRIPTVPDRDIAPDSLIEKTRIDRTVVRDSWIEHEKDKAKTNVKELKLIKAISTIDNVIQNAEFINCSTEQKYEIYAIKLQAYRLARDFDTYDRIKAEMHQAGITNTREVFIDAIRYFESLDMQNAEKCIKHAIELNPNGNEEKVYAMAIHALNNNDDISVFSSVIDEEDRLLIETKDNDEKSRIYQVLGYVFSTKYHETYRAIRCLNRAYQISNNFIILETLAITYYLHSIRNAYIDKIHDKINPAKIDKGEIDKARDIFLRVLAAGDEMWLKGTIKRLGLLLFKCFYFIRDNFRISKHYHDLLKYYEFHSREEKRDIQCCYLDIVSKYEDIDLNDYDALTEYDKNFFGLLLLLKEPMKSFNHSVGKQIPIEQDKLVDVIQRGEAILQKLIKLSSDDDRPRYDSIHIDFIYLYGNGKIRYNWDVFDEINRHFNEITNLRAKEAVEIYINELNSVNKQDVEKLYIGLFDKYNDLDAFYLLMNYYLRHKNTEKAKELYDNIFNKREDIIKDWPEYFYRDYIGFIIDHRFNLFSALKCFVEKRNEFKDNIISIYFEMEFNFSSCTFNEPNIMLKKIRTLYEEGIYKQNEYNEKCLIVNMLNCRPLEAEKFMRLKNDGYIYNLSKYEDMLSAYLCTKSTNCKETNKRWYDFNLSLYMITNGINKIHDILKWCNTKEQKSIALDFATLYYLTKNNKLNKLNIFNIIYVTHNTVSFILEENTICSNHHLKELLAYLSNNINVKILSPTLEEQIEIQDRSSDYTEINTVCLLAIKRNCPALVSDFRNEIPNNLKKNIIKAFYLNKIIDYIKQ